MDGSLQQPLSTPQAAERFRFADLQLSVGDRLQLQMPKQAAGDRCIVRLIGYVEGLSVLVTPPYLNGSRVALFEGEEIVVRAFTRRNAFGFSAGLEKVIKHPFDYLHLSFPQTVQAVQVRKAVRVRTAIIASVAVPDRGALPVPAIIADVSSSGALVDAGVAVGEIGEALRIVFRVRLHDVDSDLTVHAVIRNRYAEYAPSGGVEAFHHGVEFAGLGSTDSMILESLIYQQLVENPRGLG
jgi:hypothetical protein